MVTTDGKLQWVIFVVVVVFALSLTSCLIEARNLQSTGEERWTFQMLPKHKLVPPSGSGTIIFASPPPPSPLNFRMLPKGTPIPPSGPSTRTSASPPPPPPHLNFGMLPKGTLIPPSGPSTRTSASPPPPPPHLNFGMLHSGPFNDPPHYDVPPPPPVMPYS